MYTIHCIERRTLAIARNECDEYESDKKPSDYDKDEHNMVNMRMGAQSLCAKMRHLSVLSRQIPQPGAELASDPRHSLLGFSIMKTF